MSFPPDDPPTSSIIEYFYPPEPRGHRCGYCKSSSSNFSHGMWAHTLSPHNYELLINRGWRRSGSYVYKPMNDKVCCPMYTIRNMSTRVVVSRSQRKVLRKFKKFVQQGTVDKKLKHEKLHEGEEPMNESVVVNDRPTEFIKPAEITNNHNNVASTNNKPAPPPPPQQSTTSKKPHPLKKKFLRRERKRQKLIARGLDPEEFFKTNERNRVRELEQFFVFNNDSKHKFRTELVQVDSPEFDKCFSAEHALYQKYQMHTHGDSEHECRASQFRRFLCDNPFGEPDTSSPPRGTYHQQYYIDDKLFAVGVVDILTSCLSSVYFFYDPEYNFLSPGTLGALHEMAFVNEMKKQYCLMEHYYLGFYIHSCVKMKYKSKFRPCQLVCPVTLRWVDFDDRVHGLLDSVNGGFAKLDTHDHSRGGENQDVSRVLLLYKRKIYDFASFPHKDRDQEELESYVSLVSSEIASRILVYRSS